MMRITAHVSGRVQRVGYRARVIQNIKNTLINVSSIEKKYSKATGDFSSFYKLVGTGETDSRLDEGISVLKDMRQLLVSIRDKQDETISEIKYTNKNLGDKMDLMLEKQDETVIEIKDMNTSMSGKMEKVLDRNDITELKGDVADIKSALRAKGII